MPGAPWSWGLTRASAPGVGATRAAAESCLRPGGLRRGQPDHERRAAAGCVRGTGGPAVRVHDPGDDRQAQAGAALAALAAVLGSPEALEELRAVGHRQTGAMVAHG